MSSAKRRRRRAIGVPRASVAETRPRGLFLLLFALSGMSGLIYQVIWARQLTLVFGATSPAITTVLVSFMLGLGVGSHVAGRLTWRLGHPLRAYALIELGIAVYAVAFPFLLELFPLAHVPVFRLLVETPVALCAVRVFLAAAIMLPPTVLMGASLPVLTRALVRDGSSVGREVGMLYGLNTLGGAAGVYLGTFFLLPSVGLTSGLLSAAALNGVVGGLASVGARRCQPSPAAPRETALLASPPRRALLVPFGLSGLAALGYEVVWTRLLVVLFRASVYALAVMLAGFLLGLGLGGVVGGWLTARAVPPAYQASDI